MNFNGTIMLDTVYSPYAKSGFSKLFMAVPEFGDYVKTNRNYSNIYKSLLLTLDQVAIIQNTDTNNYQSLLNPDNMRGFFTYLEMEDYPSIYTRFTLNSKN